MAKITEDSIVLSVDLENLCDIQFAHRLISNGKNIEQLKLNLTEPINNLLNIFAKFDIRTTFFIVGTFGEEHPELVSEIISAGHEIASHSYSHPSFTELNNSEIVEELNKSKRILEKITKEKVEGFRAPTCKVTKDLYSNLKKCKYKYSSSVMPAIPIPGFYTRTSYPSTPFKKEGIIEIPLSVAPLLKTPMGGAWIRLLGTRWTTESIKKVIKKQKMLFMYLHPWECINLSTLDHVPWRIKFRTGDYYLKAIKQIINHGKNLDARFVSFQTLLKEGYFT